MKPSIPQYSADTDPDQIYEALAGAGCLVLRDVASAEQVAAVRAELAEHESSVLISEDKPDDFYPGDTRRLPALMSRSPTVRELMMNPVVEQLCGRHLLPNCSKYHLNVSGALEVGPGARDQILHREEDLFPYFPLPRPNLVLATMWAMTDFTVDNGGTQLVPGSHRWEAGRTAEPDEVVRAEMPAGSVLVWLGGTLHGAGANVTENSWRRGIILTYALGWLRQEENQHVSMPLAEALALPQDVQSRIGFGMDYENSLGFYDPSVVLSAKS